MKVINWFRQANVSSIINDLAKKIGKESLKFTQLQDPRIYPSEQEQPEQPKPARDNFPKSSEVDDLFSHQRNIFANTAPSLSLW